MAGNTGNRDKVTTALDTAGTGGSIVGDIQKLLTTGELGRALPGIGLTPERMARLSITALRTTPKLMKCDRISVLASVVQCATLGLEPNTPLGHAWILPYGSKAQLVIGYKGYIALADRGGVSMCGENVYERDRWRHPRPGDTRIAHVPFLGGDRGRWIAAYAYAMRYQRPIQFRVIGPADVEKAKDSSSSYQTESRFFNDKNFLETFQRKNGRPWEPSSPWLTDEPSMIIKTALRRLSAFVSLAADVAPLMARATALDDAADRGEPQNFGVVDMATGMAAGVADLPAEDGGAHDPAQRTDDLADRMRDAQDGASGGGANAPSVCTRAACGKPLPEKHVVACNAPYCSNDCARADIVGDKPE